MQQAVENPQEWGIATGHYARVIEWDGVFYPARAKNLKKDQSYFLWSLSNEQLAYSLFPVGDTDKEQIRKEAAQAGIPTATKKDSQGVCFLGHIDIPEFLSHYVDLVPGSVLDTDGAVIGTHRSALVYTLGQRHGFTLTNHDTERSHHYVVDRDIEKNTITVSKDQMKTAPTEKIILSDITLRTPLQVGYTVDAQFRYRQTPFPITIIEVDDTTLIIKTNGDVEKPAAGQSCVIYRNSLCLGGGTIVT